LSVNPAGPDHASAIQDTVLVQGPQFEDWGSVDMSESIPSTELSPRKARLVYQCGLWTQLTNYLVICLLVPYTKRQIQEAVESVTGWPMSYWRLMKTAERGITLAKIFNLREGFTDLDDVLPKRIGMPQRKGGLQGVSQEALSEARKLYYQMLGWDERGIPMRARLVELDIEWAASYLDAIKRSMGQSLI